MQYQTEILIPIFGMLTGIIIPVAVFIWQYKDAKGKRETVLEISKNLGEPERIQVKKYFKELKKQNIHCDLGIIINFPQPTSKDTRTNVDFVTLLPC